MVLAKRVCDLFVTFVIVLFGEFQLAYSCTSLCVTANATATGNAYVTYNADDSTGYGYMRFFPAAQHEAGEKREIIDGDTGVHLGYIPEQSPSTFNVVHRANEYGVAIGESTWEGLKELRTPYPGSIMDYESLMDIALQRATTAIEAAGVITGLAQLYGWVSLGESFSISDVNISMILEVIGKGKYGKGVVWVLYILPPGTVSGHANQPRITTCPPNVCLMHPDTIPLARTLGYQGKDEDFSFSDFFQPLEPATVRACEARVWSAFQKLTNGGMNEYLDYARGWDLTKRMPLYITPEVPVDRKMLVEIMKDTYEGTYFAFSDTDTYLGAGPYSAPYRARPLDFEVSGHRYVNERPIATQQTLTSQIAEIRGDESIPHEFRTIVWFSVDDTSLSVRIPVYTGVNKIPSSFSQKSGDLKFVNFDSAFWAFNLMSNLAYTAYSYIKPHVQDYIDKTEENCERALEGWEKLLQGNDYTVTISNGTADLADRITKQWVENWKFLFAKFKDTYILSFYPDQAQPVTAPQQVPQSWNERVVKESGDRFKIPSQKSSNTKNHQRKSYDR